MHLHALGQLCRFQANGAQNRRNPLVTGELSATFTVAVKIKAADLDGAQIFNVKRVPFNTGEVGSGYA